ncbi:MAG TPA: TolC family protein [Woeseiaceae bacterium]|nr:TolC family protein [Woeseiaceae bacterium]
MSACKTKLVIGLLMKQAIRPVVLCCLLASPVVAAAETLHEAWLVALASHNRIAAASAERDAAEDDYAHSKAERLPRVDLNSAYTQFDEAPRFSFGSSFVSPPLFDGDSILTTSALASLPLYPGGLLPHSIAAADASVRAAEHQLASVRQDIKLGVAVRYVQVLRAQRQLAVAKSNVTTLGAHTLDTKNQFEAGAVPRNDYLAATVSLANAELGHLQAANALDLANADYNRMLGRALDETVTLESALTIDAIAPLAQSLDEATTLALAQRAELAAFTAQAQSLQNRSLAERARSKPQLALAAGYNYLENDVLDDDQFWSIGIGFEWQLFDGGRSKKQASALARRASARQHQRDDLARSIALQVRQAWLDHDVALNRELVARASVQQATENLRVARDRYRAGAGTSTEVLDAETLRTLSLNNRDNAELDVALTSLTLLWAIGAL